MKITENARFPHPVLSPCSCDFREGEFSMQFTVSENSAPDRYQVALDYTMSLTEPTLRQLVEQGKAAAGIFASCLDTYYSRLIALGLDRGSFSFEPGALAGRVTLRPVVWTCGEVKEFPVGNCHEEFGGAPIPLPAGSVLAVDEEVTIQVGPEKLMQIETIFSIAKSDQLESGMLSVSLDSDRIKVLAAADIYETVNRLKSTEHARAVILNSVFLPAVIQVLDSLRDGASAYEGRRWYRVFSAKCDHLGIHLFAPDL